MTHRLVITVVRGARVGQRFELVQTHVRLGRRPDNDVAMALEDGRTSGRHAEITQSDGRVLLRDVGSTNGTFVDGSRIEGSVELASGQRIELGRDGPIVEIQITPATPRTIAGSDTELSEDQRSAPAHEPTSGRTAIYRALIVDTVAHSSRRLKLMILMLCLILVGGTVWAVTYIQSQSEQTDSLRREARAARVGQEQLAEETSRLARRLLKTDEALNASRGSVQNTSARLAALRKQIAKADGAARTKLEAQAEELDKVRIQYERELASHQRELTTLKRSGKVAQDIARVNEQCLFMLIAELPDREVGFCTAFAMSALGMLVTNAHCVGVLADYQKQGHRVLARMNRAHEKTYLVNGWRRHADYNNTAFSPDVAIVNLDLAGSLLPAVVQFASDAKVRDLAPGQPIYTMGFPGRVMNEARPAADFRAAVISRLTDYDNRPAPGAQNPMVWHSALTSKGTSGSPIFDGDGEVIAVNNGGLSARRVTNTDAKGTTTTTVAYDATGLNFGIRVDAIRDVIAQRANP
ncbi:MAG: pSer/pThr/pTyr-binding forkhead associated (FHA) protein [Myxococcota bacterium]|jgi:pSer/pThr/pTyr-binding forkhead associated (FHA) protein